MYQKPPASPCYQDQTYPPFKFEVQPGEAHLLCTVPDDKACFYRDKAKEIEVELDGERQTLRRCFNAGRRDEKLLQIKGLSK